MGKIPFCCLNKRGKSRESRDSLQLPHPPGDHIEKICLLWIGLLDGNIFFNLLSYYRIIQYGINANACIPLPLLVTVFLFIHGNCRGVKGLWVYNHEEKTKTKKHGYCVLVDSKKIFFFSTIDTDFYF